MISGSVHLGEQGGVARCALPGDSLSCLLRRSEGFPYFALMDLVYNTGEWVL